MATAGSLPTIGDSLPGDAEAASNPATPIPPKLTGLSPHVIVRDGVVFTVGVDADGVVRYLGTSDPAFSTPDGVSTETRMVDLIGSGKASSTVEVNEDQSSSMLLGSGWWAAIPSGISVDTKVSQVYLK